MKCTPWVPVDRAEVRLWVSLKTLAALSIGSNPDLDPHVNSVLSVALEMLEVISDERRQDTAYLLQFQEELSAALEEVQRLEKSGADKNC